MLKQIVERKRRSVAEQKEKLPQRTLERTVAAGSGALSRALAAREWSLIAECKTASPAKGRLPVNHTVTELAAIYEDNGAAALSVHTDPHFCGCLEDLSAVRAQSRLPILRKDFLVDEYQLWESRAAGADAVLLMASVLTDRELARFLEVASSLGLDALVEIHSSEELARVQNLDIRLLGINNRDLRTFRTDIEQTFQLLPHCPSGCLLISESGIRSGGDAQRLRQGGVRAILVGEHLSTAPDVAAMTAELAMIKKNGTEMNNGGRRHDNA